MKEEEGQGNLVAKSKGAVEKYDFDSENIYIKVTLKLWFFVNNFLSMANFTSSFSNKNKTK